jgi:hypothetical protein
LFLLFSFGLFFRQWSHPLTRFFLSLDLTVLYDPVYFWVHRHLARGLLPLICDDAMQGAPVAAYSMAGVLSPALWLFHAVSSFPLAFNLLFLAPQALYLAGTYFLGRKLGFSGSASLLLGFLWCFNGHQMAQLDHLNVAWAHAFFPWAFLFLLRHLETDHFLYLLLASLCLGLDLLSGHPQVFFLECLFFLFWALFSPSYRPGKRILASAGMGLGALVVSSPLVLFTLECLKGDFPAAWSPIDRFYHSWTPLNVLTLLYPWFFGKIQYDRASSDYWWQYQFVEMQVAFSIAGLFFILLFFLRKGDQRKWVSAAFLFALLMALGKFSPLYPWIQSLPVFSFFRDPARYWFLATWVLGLGAAWAWDGWFEEEGGEIPGKKTAIVLCGIILSVPLLGSALASWGRPLLTSAGSFFIRHFLQGDPAHPHSPDFYRLHLGQKLDLLAWNLDPRHLRVFLPILFSFGLLSGVAWRKHWNPSLLKMFLLLLVLADLYAFRMPLGSAFYKPSDIPSPAVGAPADRTLTLLSENTSPLPSQYGEMAYPNMNMVFGRPNLVFDANPIPASYATLWAQLGWFSWVYRDRDPLGFAHRPDLLRLMGVDQVVSDHPLEVAPPFLVLRDRYPYVYRLPGAYPRAYLARPEGGDLVPAPSDGRSDVHISRWDETRLSISALVDHPMTLVLQKTFLPGWKARLVDLRPAPPRPVKGSEDAGGFRVAYQGSLTPFRCDRVLTALSLPEGEDQVELVFNPTGLRLGFFLLLGFLGALTFSLFHRLLA